MQPTASLLSAYDWRADLFCHFREPALLVTLIACTVVLRKRPKLAIVLGALAIVQFVPLFRYAGSNPVPPDPKAPERLRILMLNVLTTNLRHDEVIRLIRRENPDVVGLVEFTPLWSRGLAEVRESYPHHIDAPGGASGLALWFREPPRTLDPPERLTPDDFPFLHAAFDFAGRTRQLWIVHPRQPLSPKARRSGNPELAALADRVHEIGGSRIVIGDLNAADASGSFRGFLRKTGLPRLDRLGFGRQPKLPGRPFSPNPDRPLSSCRSNT